MFFLSKCSASSPPRIHAPTLESTAEIDGELLRIREEVPLFDFNIFHCRALAAEDCEVRPLHFRLPGAFREEEGEEHKKCAHRIRAAVYETRNTIQRCYDVFFRLGAWDGAVVSRDDDALVA
jgi:hypothetical protein